MFHVCFIYIYKNSSILTFEVLDCVKINGREFSVHNFEVFDILANYCLAIFSVSTAELSVG